MNYYFHKAIFLTSRFEQVIKKYAQQLSTDQAGTTELFFDSEAKQQSFASAIQDPNGAIYKLLAALFAKTNAPVSFDLKATAEPNLGASWGLTVQPASAKASVSTALDKIFQQIVGTTMATKLQTANLKAKTGSGSGTLNIGSLELS